MKKNLAAILALILVTIVSTAAYAATPAKTAQALKGTPTIDAEVDEIWKEAPVIKDFNQSGEKVMHQVTDIQPSVRFLWDEQALYVLAEVKDSTVGGTAVPSGDLSNNDGVEIYLDQNNAKATSFESDDICIKVDYKGTYVNVKNASEGVKYSTRIVSDGYVVEISIPWSHMEPLAGKIVGLDVEISDNKLGGKMRATWLLWNDETNQAWVNPSVFGNLELAGTDETKTENQSENSTVDAQEQTPVEDNTKDVTEPVSIPDTDQAEKNPQTGDASVFLYMAAIIPAGVCMFTSRYTRSKTR